MKKLLGLLLVSSSMLAACGGTDGLSTKKNADGEYLVATIKGEDGNEYNVEITADQHLDAMMATNAGQQVVYGRLEREVVVAGYIADETTFGQSAYNELMKEHSILKDSLINEYKDLHKADYEKELDKLVKSVGAKDLNDYVEYYVIYDTVLEELNSKYRNDFEKHDDFTGTNPAYQLSAVQDQAFKNYVARYNPLDVTHILVSTGGTIADAAITKEQGENLADVWEKLTTGDLSFGKIAETFSDDPGSAAKDGDLGLVHMATPFVNEFKYPMYAWANGETMGAFTGELANGTGVDTFDSGEVDFDERTDIVADLFTTGTIPNGNATLKIENLGDTAFSDFERDAAFATLFDESRMGTVISTATLSGNTSITDEILVARSEHGIHFIQLNNLAEYSTQSVDNANTDYLSGLVDGWLYDDADDADTKFNTKSILGEYWNKYQTDFYWNLFVNGNMGETAVTGLVPLEITFTTGIESDLTSFFDLKRTSAWAADVNAFDGAMTAWREKLVTDKYFFGYNKTDEEDGAAFTNGYTNGIANWDTTTWEKGGAE